MKLVKCPECNGEGQYEIEQHYQGEVYLTPVTCPYCGGEKRITWSHFCSNFRKPKNYHKSSY